ncbi:hypothetical protein ACLM5J_17115 [Nocardioides sp. Bht2]|uniref:hypothetical protein n=1 Tax=Nocardioides sp. Bht2 TaxID=3392297 RepID=UPI0039B37702
MRRRRLIAVLVVLVMVATGLGLWWWNRDDDPRVEVGDVLVGAQIDDVAFDQQVRLPWAQAVVRVGDPVDAVGLLDARVRAPRDGSLVAVSVEFGDALARPLRPGVALTPPQFTLLADGREYPLPDLVEDAMLSGGSYLMADFARLVAVEGSDPELAVRISLAGESMEVSGSGTAPGRFAEFDALGPLGSERSESLDCGQPTLERGSRVVGEKEWMRGSCERRGQLRTPFIDGLGWAEPDHEWAVLEVTAGTPQRLARDGVVLRPERDTRDAITLRATGAGDVRYRVEALRPGPWQDGRQYFFAVEVPRGESAQLRVQVRTAASSAEESYRDLGGSVFTWRFELPI